MSMFANIGLLGSGIRLRFWIKEQGKIKRRSKAPLSLCWQTWTSFRYRNVVLYSLYLPSFWNVEGSLGTRLTRYTFVHVAYVLCTHLHSLQGCVMINCSISQLM